MRDTAFDWQMPVALRFGTGCSADLPEALGPRQALVLAFAPAEAMVVATRWRADLTQRLVDWVSVPDGLASLACARNLASRVWTALASAPDCVLVALGGGTTLDIAKLLRCRPVDHCFDRLTAALRGQADWPAMTLAPLWLVPTTAGTGSEVTRWATLWDTDAEPAVKRSLDEPWGYAERAFVDPALASSCPPALTRDAALDTLAHALEAMWNHHANPISDRLAVQAARRVIASLPQVLAWPDDLTLRSELSLAALEAGLAFSQTRTALAHALSYDVTLTQGVPHGLACAMWLPTAWSLALGRNDRVDARLAEVFGAPASFGPARLKGWLEGLGIDPSPAAFGITDADARLQAALLSARGRNFIGAPVHDD